MAASSKKKVARGKRPARAKVPAPPAWQDILDTLLVNPGMSRRAMFGADAIGLGGKYFAMCWQGQLLAKLPRERVDALVAAGTGTYFDPGMGKPSGGWLQVAPAGADWSVIVEEALAYCASLQA